MLETLIETPSSHLSFIGGPLCGFLCEEGWLGKDGEVIIGAKGLYWGVGDWTIENLYWIPWLRKNPDLVVRYALIDGELVYQGKEGMSGTPGPK